MRSKGRIDILKPSSNDGTVVSGFEKLSIYKENDGSHNGLSVTHGAGVIAKVWDSENDGPGSGLDADLLDGKHASDFENSSISLSSGTDLNTLNSGKYHTYSSAIIASLLNCPVNTGELNLIVYNSGLSSYVFQELYSITLKTVYQRTNNGGTWSVWQEAWNSNNDGSGSGLDADLLDGKHASEFATSTHNHDTTYLGKTEQALDSAKLGGYGLSSFYGNFESSVLPILNQQRTNLGNPSVFEAAVIDSQFTNKVWFFPISYTTFERSTDDITYNIASDITDDQKRRLFGGAGNTNAYISIPKGQYLRITLDAPSYSFLNMLYMWYTYQGDNCFLKIEKYSLNTASWSNVIDYQGFGSWPAHTVVRHPTIAFANYNTTSHFSRVRITIKVNPDTTGGVYTNHILNNIEWWGGYPDGRRTIYYNDGLQNVYFPASVQSNETINFDTNNVEPTQIGTVTKTSTWLWQYLTQSMNYSWLKLKTWVGGLFSAGSATTNNNYLPKIDDVNKKLVKSNIYDDGTTPKYGTNTIWHSGNDGPGSGLDADLLDGLHANQLNSSHDHIRLQFPNDTVYAGLQITPYKIIMANALTNKFEPLTIGDTTATTKTVNTTKFLLNSPIIVNNENSTINADALITGSYFITGMTSYLNRTSNTTGLNDGQPLFLKGKVNDSINSSYQDGSFQLDNTTLTSWLTQSIPNSNNGFAYILLGYISYGELFLLPHHPIYRATEVGPRLYIPGGKGSYNDADLIWGNDPLSFVSDVINTNNNVVKYPNGLSFNPQNSRTFDFSSNNYYDGTAYTLVGGSATYTIANPVLGKIMYAALPPKPTSFNITFTPNVTVIGTPSSVAGKTNLIRITCINATTPKYIAEILIH